jgi:hypothetical protein
LWIPVEHPCRDELIEDADDQWWKDREDNIVE